MSADSRIAQHSRILLNVPPILGRKGLASLRTTVLV